MKRENNEPLARAQTPNGRLVRFFHKKEKGGVSPADFAQIGIAFICKLAQPG